MVHVPTLYLLCGKISSGKSTLARDIAARPSTLLISEDHWTSSLFSDDLKTIDDYVRYSGRLRTAMGPHIVDILRQGLSVVLDFPANTVRSRNCKRRLQERNAGGAHPFQASESEFDLFTSYFVPPGPDEGFNVIVHTP
jgi:predicted kinase